MLPVCKAPTWLDLPSIYTLPVENRPTGLGRIHRHRHRGADRLVALIQYFYVPGGLRLKNDKVVLAAALAGDDRVPVPFIVAD